jgi:GT2 family glycosyltransferase
VINKVKTFGRRLKNKLNRMLNNEKVESNNNITDINYGVDHYIYATSPHITHINTDDNIGEDGSNLTIMVLSCNRVQNTITLIESMEKYMPDFKGVLLIVDNNSDEEQLNILKVKAKKLLYKCEIVGFSENYGIAGGRQRAMDFVKTQWVMLLDNDIYFTTNPMKKLQKDISILGCHFINMPLMDETIEHIFTNGGNLYIDYRDADNIFVNSGSVFVQGKCEKNTEFNPSLSTFIYGGTSVVKKDTFLKCGGFDENMFIGFEDSDFSIRVFRSGYKIGNCGILALVHNHTVPKNNTDIEYEKSRFSNQRLKESAMYFEKKNKYKVWNPGIEEWINQRNKELNLENK